MPDRMLRDRYRSSAQLRDVSDAEERAWWRLQAACDDHGRFDGDPEVLLAELFKRRPAGWTPAKMDKAVDGLERVALLHRYHVGGAAYGHLLTWQADQRERDSRPRFPDPPCEGLPHLAAKCGESRQSAAPSVSDFRLPRAEGRGTITTPRGEPPQGAAAVDPGETWGTPEALVAAYNRLTPPECPAVQVLSPARRAKARRYLAMFPELAWWEACFQRIHRSPFLRGLVKRAGHEHFVADLDWLLTKGKDGSENAVKVYDGRYEER